MSTGRPTSEFEPAIDLVDGDFWGRNPQDELAWLREHAPVWRDERNGVWAVSTYELVKQVSTRPELYSSAGGIRPDYGPTPMMIDMDDPDHRKRRKLLNKGFTPNRVRDLGPSILRTVDDLIDGVQGSGACDLVTDLAAWLPLIVIADMLGVATTDRVRLLDWSDDLMRMLGRHDEATAERGVQASTEYFAYAAQTIESRRGCPADDIISVLLESEVDGDRLDDVEITFETLLLLIGGDETTRHVISGGVFQLLSNRGVWDALVADRSLVPSAVEEMLRWVSPVKNMARTAARDLELGGQRIAEGEKLLLLYPSANRDSEVFVDPCSFDICRSPNEHVAFGFGPHFCLGASLARLELRVILERLLERLPDLELDTDVEPPHRPANFVSGYESLPVRFSHS